MGGETSKLELQDSQIQAETLRFPFTSFRATADVTALDVLLPRVHPRMSPGKASPSSTAGAWDPDHRLVAAGFQDGSVRM